MDRQEYNQGPACCPVTFLRCGPVALPSLASVALKINSTFQTSSDLQKNCDDSSESCQVFCRQFLLLLIVSIRGYICYA